MSQLADHQIISLAERGMITPFERECVSEIESPFEAIDMANRGSHVRKVISYGPTSYGYDIRLANEFKLFRPKYDTVIDPKHPDPSLFEDIKADVLQLPPHSYCLARTIERFVIPNDILVICLGKSTYARCGFLINVTPAEPEWEGYLTLEIANLTPCPALVYANEGIAQFVFFRGESKPKWTYATKNKGKPSKYQNQEGVTPGKV
jgi:dCTP deaminase